MAEGATRGQAPVRSASRLPFAVLALGTAALLLLAAGTAFATARVRVREGEIPRVALDYQARLTTSAAQAMRRAVNQGVEDLEQVAEQRAADDTSTDELERGVRALMEVHDRYESAYVLGARRRVVGLVGAEAQPVRVPRSTEHAGMGAAFAGSEGAVAVQYAPSGDDIVVGHYDLDFLRFPAEVVEPGDAWVVDRKGDVIWSSAGSTLFEPVPGRSLREAVRRASNGDAGAFASDRSGGEPRAVGYAPVEGVGPAGDVGWVLVTARAATSLPSAVNDVRRIGYTTALVLAILTLVVFGSLYAVVIAPGRHSRRSSSTRAAE